MGVLVTAIVKSKVVPRACGDEVNRALVQSISRSSCSRASWLSSSSAYRWFRCVLLRAIPAHAMHRHAPLCAFMCISPPSRFRSCRLLLLLLRPSLPAFILQFRRRCTSAASCRRACRHRRTRTAAHAVRALAMRVALPLALAAMLAVAAALRSASSAPCPSLGADALHAALRIGVADLVRHALREICDPVFSGRVSLKPER